jgi:hypothetical protein
LSLRTFLEIAVPWVHSGLVLRKGSQLVRSYYPVSRRRKSPRAKGKGKVEATHLGGLWSLWFLKEPCDLSFLRLDALGWDRRGKMGKNMAFLTTQNF